MPTSNEFQLTAELLRQLLHYDPETGVFRWRISIPGKLKEGDVAGSDWGGGRRAIKIRGRNYKASRLAWLYVRGVWPTALVDHENGNCADDRFSNLREATRSINNQNQRRAHRNNKSTGVMGVRARRGRFPAQITHAAKDIHLGTFDTADEAHEAYLNAKRRLHAGCVI